MIIQYIGEHLFAGHLGISFVWISFVAAILSSLFYFLNTNASRSEKRLLRPLSRSFFFLHALSLIGVAVVLYYLIFKHYFEYSYVWEYSSRTLPVKYIISCFWAGQEGSFLVWAIAQAIIGIILVFIAKDWENHVMSVVSLSQIFVTSMMLGIQIGSLKIGASPFLLLREALPTIRDTIFQDPNYLSMIEDGNGLNPLLENIWMTIHPPVLFIGYALAMVPFSYAIASLMRKDFISWLKPALPWTLLSLTLLGAGILLGGAWAYVSLTFGGFWSWDPVENSSLVPWLTLIGGLHFLLIARKQHHALMMTYIFLCLSYVLVLYASFLTRSGVLADTSAHSFGDNGLTTQLLIFLLVFLALMITMITINVRKFYEKKKELLLSREFWMFIGAIIIVLSAFQIIFTTSIPVFNKMFGTDFAPPSERVAFYNKWQAPYALLVAGFIAFTQFLNYNINLTRDFLRKMIFPVILSIGFLVPFIVQGIVGQLNFILLLFFILFALFSSLLNLLFRTAYPRNVAAVITHLGFGIFLLGTLLTFSNSRVISANTSEFDLGSEKQNAENLLLQRNDTLYMGGFYLTYASSVARGNLTEYQVDFLKWEKGKFTRKFSLYPSVNRNPRMGDVYNPDTRHFLMRDYYIYISFVSNSPEYIVIRAIMNPYINLLWIGSVVMIIGLIYASWKRIRARTINNS